MNLPGARMYGIITFTFFRATLKTTSMERAGNAPLQSNAGYKRRPYAEPSSRTAPETSVEATDP